MKVCLIDADSIIYSICAVNSESDDFAIYKNTVNDWITNIITKCECSHYLGFLTIGRVFRHEVAVTREYKSGRAKDKPKFYYELRKHLIDHWKFSYQDGVEAEDLVAIAISILKACTVDYIIAGIDHDLLQLPGTHYNYRKSEFKTITPYEADYNLWKQMLTGCSTDKIQGIPGIGESKAHNMLTNKDLVYNSEILRSKVLECYIKTYGLCRGIAIFTETFQLIFLLRTIDNIKYILNIDYTVPEPIELVVTKEKPKEDII